MKPIVVVLAAIALAVMAFDAVAQGAARSVQIDPSVRASGMGGASTAVFWSNDTNEWANPALLAYQKGLQYHWSTTQLIPEIAPDVRFRAHRLGFGWGGLGLGVSRLTLDYGESEGTDEQGNPTGTFGSFERITPLGLGVSISLLLESLALLRGGEVPSIARYADVAFGYKRKDVDLQLAPSPAGSASTTSNDLGFLVRVSPLPMGEESRPFLDLSYGYSALNHNDAEVFFSNQNNPNYVARHYRNGLAARFGIPTSPGMASTMEQRFGRWLGSGMNPLLSIAIAGDFSHFESVAGWQAYDVDHFGLEIALLNVFAARVGHVTDRLEEIDDFSFGGGVGLPIGSFASVRYDFASFPHSRPSELDPMRRHAVTVWFDPLTLARR
ncbi:MAG TPA: hypothetical protein VEY91_12855 [Candidatus Limnocylindria bacterium]|nr:hypothetical protein [Candidatus Limnocylindria bacterium]